MDQIYQALFAGAALLLTTLSFIFRDWIVSRFTPKENLRRRIQNGLAEQCEVFNALGRISDLPYVDRVLMFEGKNDGGFPRAGKRYSVRCLTGSSRRDGTGPIWKYHEPFPIDRQYMEMLLSICREDGPGWLRFTTSLLPADSMLRSFYEREGVIGSGVFYVCVQAEERRLVFLSIANYSRPFTDSEMHEITPLIGGVVQTIGGE